MIVQTKYKLNNAELFLKLSTRDRLRVEDDFQFFSFLSLLFLAIQ